MLARDPFLLLNLIDRHAEGPAMHNHEEEDERILETEPKGALEPPRHRPPTAVGAAVVPGGQPFRPRAHIGKPRRESLLFRVLLGIADILDEATRRFVRVVNR